MEFFYRNMRKKYDLLMLQGQPLGGKWNFDKTTVKNGMGASHSTTLQNEKSGKSNSL